MKEQWSISENQLVALEEGRHQHKQVHVKKIEYEPSYCMQCISYLKLIFLLQIILLFGWGCYMILETRIPQRIENKATYIIPERYPSIFEPPSEIQKSRPSTEAPVIFVKPEVIIDKLNNFLEGMELTKEQNLIQSKTVVTNMAHSVVSTNTQNTNNMQNNDARVSDVTSLSTLSSENIVQDEKFTNSLVPQKISSTKYVDENVNTVMNEKSLYEQFLEKLRIIDKLKEANNLEMFDSKNDYTEDANQLTLKSQENDLDMFSKFESLELDDAIILTVENLMERLRMVNMNLTNDSQELKQKIFNLDGAQNDYSVELTNIWKNVNQSFSCLKFSDIVKKMQNDHSSFEISKQINKYLKLDFNICLSTEFHEFFYTSLKDIIISFISQLELQEMQELQEIQEISEENEAGSRDDINARNEDGDNSNMSTSLNASENQDYFKFITLTAITPNTEQQHSSENIKNEDEKYDMTEDIKNPSKRFLEPTAEDSVESSNVNKFQWFNAPPLFADSLERKDISEEFSKMKSSLFSDPQHESTVVDDVIPGSKCEITLEMEILKINCSGIRFDEQWNLTSSEIHPIDDLIDDAKVTNSGDNFYLDYYLDDFPEQLDEIITGIDNENSNKEVTTPQDTVHETINAVELQESTPTAETSNSAIRSQTVKSADMYRLFTFPLDENYDIIKEITETVTTISPFTSEFDFSIISHKGHNLFPEISDTQREKQFKIIKEQDSSISDNINISNDCKCLHSFEEKLISALNSEALNIMAPQYRLRKFYEDNYPNNICIIAPHLCTTSPYSLHDQYTSLKKLLEYLEERDNKFDINNNNHRKKRMTDELTWQQEQISNTVEDDKNVDLLVNLKKIFQKMEILAVCIDRLHERYLLHNKLDDDYTSSEFPLEAEEDLELYTPRPLYEK
ncbi:uncharacterized protein LOC105432493 [Pogonomyrmex barbatus]|uniref:Uncharacterized protein LOC105432493 n=1 Tax=Pogonomyrmex barbatus TaxID=144034 RepID=A0A6I9WPN0_9HYME|nr:uncharacterized protein LOC105432493 [Pogonomyrmex barbatus]